MNKFEFENRFFRASLFSNVFHAPRNGHLFNKPHDDEENFMNEYRERALRELENEKR